MSATLLHRCRHLARTVVRHCPAASQQCALGMRLAFTTLLTGIAVAVPAAETLRNWF